jgi:hypothetical protein
MNARQPKWKYPAAFLALSALPLTACAAMHAQAVTNLRANGEHAKADCYERCAPDDPICTNQCENDHPRRLTAQEIQLVTGAVAADNAKRAQANAASNQPTSESAPQNQASGGSASGSTAQRTLTINGTTYTGGPELGKPCSLDSPCPGGYSCHLVTERSGQCVQ